MSAKQISIARREDQAGLFRLIDLWHSGPDITALLGRTSAAGTSEKSVKAELISCANPFTSTINASAQKNQQAHTDSRDGGEECSRSGRHARKKMLALGEALWEGVAKFAIQRGQHR